jgi:hypothetical protein
MNPASPTQTSVATASCFGYSLPQDIPFQTLRRGGGTPLEVILDPDRAIALQGDLMLEWFRDGRSISRLDGNSHAYRLWTRDAGWFHIEPDVPSGAVSRVGGLRWESALLGVPAALCFARRGDLPVHAAAVDVGGAAIMLTAPGYHGKTTLAAAFVAAGHRLLAEDVACVSYEQQEASLIPGPSMIRLRPDVHSTLRIPGTSVALEEPGRVFLSIDEDRRGDSSPVPLKAVLFLRAGDGEAVLERVSPERAVPDLYLLGFRVPTDNDHARSFRAVADLVARVPVWNLSRRLSFEGLPELVDRIVSTCLG